MFQAQSLMKLQTVHRDARRARPGKDKHPSGDGISQVIQFNRSIRILSSCRLISVILPVSRFHPELI